MKNGESAREDQGYNSPRKGPKIKPEKIRIRFVVTGHAYKYARDIAEKMIAQGKAVEVPE